MQWMLHLPFRSVQTAEDSRCPHWIVCRNVLWSPTGRNEDSVSTLTASVDLRPTVRSVVTARRVVGELLTAWAAPHDRLDAELLVSEVVANVVDHAGGESVLTLEVSLSDTWLRISVTDGSAIRPVVQELNHQAPRGRGMQLVEAIADRWGADDHQGGKRVWLELRTPGV
jgi:anti-sigma regulatory factor (Ser/Thr protein kinase)